MKPSTAHIIINAHANGRLECHHCGQSYQPTMPAPLNIYQATVTAFTATHRHCERPDSGCIAPPVPVKPAPEAARAIAGLYEWLQTGKRGNSSETIVEHLTGIPVIPTSRMNAPYDADDFGRCQELLTAAPELRQKLEAMTSLSPVWANLITEWPRLETLFETGQSRALTAAIQQIRLIANTE